MSDIHPTFGEILDAFNQRIEHGRRPRTPDGQLIVTSFVYPPIPIRCFDWSAVTENYDGAPDAGWQPQGTGATEAEAIADLLEQIEERS